MRPTKEYVARTTDTTVQMNQFGSYIIYADSVGGTSYGC